MAGTAPFAGLFPRTTPILVAAAAIPSVVFGVSERFPRLAGIGRLPATLQLNFQTPLAPNKSLKTLHFCELSAHCSQRLWPNLAPLLMGSDLSVLTGLSTLNGMVILTRNNSSRGRVNAGIHHRNAGNGYRGIAQT